MFNSIISNCCNDLYKGYSVIPEKDPERENTYCIPEEEVVKEETGWGIMSKMQDILFK